MAEVKFFADVHISVDAISQAQKLGIDIIRSLDVGLAQEDDDEILLDYATQTGRILITCDHGFELRYYDWMAQGKSYASILYFNMASGDCSNIGLMLEWISMIRQSIDPEHEHINQFWRAS